MQDRQIRRKDRAVSRDEALDLLNRCEYGFLGTADQDGRPYVVPLSYALMDGAVYFHCAAMGHKLDNIAANPAVCFSVVGATKPVFDGGFSTYYESAAVFGQARLVRDDEERTKALTALARKYLPGHMDACESEIAKNWIRTQVYAVSMDRVTGKAKRRKAPKD